jgi:hypothetical protein
MRVTVHWRTWVTMGAVLAVLIAAVPALAQGLYYKEIRRDGRIYVFNNAAEAERFEKTGEMGIGITRPGTGPNGETVIGDNERALQLFYFKHGLSEAVPEAQPPVQRIEWRDGKTRITLPNAYLEMSNRVQTRYTHEFPDDAVTLAGTESPGDSKGSFRIRRAKFKLEGWIWIPPATGQQPKLSFEVQTNWPAVSGSNAGALLEDAYLAWDPNGRGQFRVLTGQFKAPLGRQELTSSGSQQFVDRSLVSNEYSRGRDTGVAVQGVLGANKLEYRAAIFNGNGLTRTANDNATFQANARLMWQPNGSQALAQRPWVSGALYSEGDFESTTTPIYAVAVTFEHNDFHRTTTGNDLKSNIVGIDGVFKFKGFSATGEYYFRRREPETGSKFDSNGGFVQVGMMLTSFRTWEAAFRYGHREVSDLVDDDEIIEIRGGISYYYRRHALKFQADFGQVEDRRGPSTATRKDQELRLQAQFIF